MEENLDLEDQNLQDLLLLEIIEKHDKGETISYDEFRKEMGWE
ncbi:hypothetical protein [Dyadobacter sp. CY261]|nr:hypothetical protein [Dyadobacter sp. CY261]